MDEQCKRQFLLLIFAIQFCHVRALSYDSVVDLNHFDYPDTDPEATSDLQKRFSKFVRIGRGLSSFMRIGRQNPNGAGAFYQLEDLPDDEFTDSNEGAFYDFEPTHYDSSEKSIGPYVGVGRNYDDEADNDLKTGGVEKRGGAFIRMGKFPTSAFLHSRAGRVKNISPTKYYRRTGRIGHSSFIRIGKRDTTEALKRLEADNVETDDNKLERYNKYRDEQEINDTDEEAEHKRWLKIGRELANDNNGVGALIEQPEATIDDTNTVLEDDLENSLKPVNKRFSSFVRIGKSYDDMGSLSDKPDMYEVQPNKFVNFGGSENSPDKRFSSFVRIGRDADKRRFSSFVRIGKSPLNPYNPYNSDINKRLSSFVRIGKGYNPYKDDVDKRISSFVRIGKKYSPLDTDFNKRYSSFVRIGKSSDDDITDDVNKRYSSFVRIGKDNSYSNEDLQKRLSAFMRVGKGDQDAENGNGLDKRYSSFVRIGKNIPAPLKRYSSFVRIGKNVGDSADKRLSSFMRVGKDNIGQSSSNGESNSDMADLPSYYSEEQEHIIDKRASNNEDSALETESNNAEAETS